LCDGDGIQPAENTLCNPIPQGDLLSGHLNPEVHLRIGNAQLPKVSLPGLGVRAAFLVSNNLPINSETCQKDGQGGKTTRASESRLAIRDLLRGSKVGAPRTDLDF
jgi:hypothetical protein